MEKKHNLSTSQSNTENTNPKSIGPSSDELKNRFKEGSIPLQTDYSDLIDIADIGRRTVGKAPDQTDNPNSGLELDNNHGLSVKTNPTGGISVDSSGIAVKCWPSGGITVTDGSGLYLKLAGGNSGNGWSGVSGLSLGTDGVKIKANNGINVDGNGVAVKVKDKSLLTDAGGLAVNTGRGLWINNDKLEVNNHDGIEIVNEGVKVKAGNGINVDGSGVAVKAKDNTINVESTGISVRLGWGIKIGDGLDVKAGNGITADWNGVSVKSKDNTIRVDPTGISVNLGWGVTVGGGLDVKASNGIHVDSNGVSVKAKAGNGIKVDSDGVSIDLKSIASALADLIIPSGTIVPFYGNNYDNPPSGWVWCDGSNGTPNLNTNSDKHGSTDYINLISGSTNKSTNYWQLEYGTHVAANVYFMRYIMKK
ncbi:tail fiber protein [Photorhabdus noenieputensis]|uniref:tail fiber protein n=1 Tax=Photorhabdus noenieputensis TaxID=1208607 RepID=UPI001BD42FB8|nr:tail fiber protein [Photorhabdus noenieputensis]MBS9436416.1 tail fiber protein [Photorhabdus noenieputensis]MCK3670890.1 tail fiber protein [Photorhabdus noenieputensis]